jgi:hypothetical protein
MIKTFCISIILFTAQIQAQRFEDLDSLSGYRMNVYFSPGYEERTRDIASRVERASDYFSTILDLSPRLYLFVLDQDVWKKYGVHPLFGMPHSFDSEDKGTNLVVASRDNDFWKSFIPAQELSSELEENIKKAYSDSAGNLSMRPFFDLLAIHELGHGFHIQGGLKMQRLWMQELFVNIMLHTYVAENEPENLPALTVFPEMVIASGTEGFEYTTLDDFELRYDNMSGQNYGWFQSRLHSAAKDIYNAGGKEVLIKLWNALKTNERRLSDSELLKLLDEKVHREVGNVLREWD